MDQLAALMLFLKLLHALGAGEVHGVVKLLVVPFKLIPLQVQLDVGEVILQWIGTKPVEDQPDGAVAQAFHTSRHRVYMGGDFPLHDVFEFLGHLGVEYFIHDISEHPRVDCRHNPVCGKFRDLKDGDGHFMTRLQNLSHHAYHGAGYG